MKTEKLEKILGQRPLVVDYDDPEAWAIDLYKWEKTAREHESKKLQAKTEECENWELKCRSLCSIITNMTTGQISHGEGARRLRKHEPFSDATKY